LYVAIILGTAGSGKSALTAAIADYLDNKGEDFATVNLDPGTLEENLPYEPDINVRDYIRAEEIMTRYKLGPNGAMVASMDLTVRYIENLKSDIENYAPDYLIVDTPGQMEIFAYRPAGPMLLKGLFGEPDYRASLIFIFDPFLCSISPNTLLSLIFLSISVFWRFGLPIVNVLSKKDLFPNEEIQKIIEYINEPARILDAITEFPLRDEYGGWVDYLKMENNFSLDIIPVSSATSEGIFELFSELLNTWSETG